MLFDPGIEFTRFATPNALCGPSRLALLRGQYGHNTGATSNRRLYAHVHGQGLEQSTIATWLHDSGYATALFGKYINGYGRRIAGVGRDYVPPGWTEWYGGAPGGAFSFWLNENGTVVHFDADGPHANDVLGDLAVSFIHRHAEGPMFLYVAPGSPHGRAWPAHRHDGAFGDAEPPEGPSTYEADVSDKPAWIRNLHQSPTGNGARRLQQYRNRLRSMLSVEDLIASVMEALRADSQLENTYFIFTSDNGFHYGEHRIKAAKATAYGESIFVPTAIRGPGIPGGEQIDHLAANSDLAETMAEWGGATIPDFVDGKSLTPLLRPNRPVPGEWRRAIGLEHPHPMPHGDGPSPGFVGIQQNRCKYVRYETLEEEIYDTELDPYELTSVHESLDVHTRHDLRAWATALASCKGQVCRELEADAPEVECNRSCSRNRVAIAPEESSVPSSLPWLHEECGNSGLG